MELSRPTLTKQTRASDKREARLFKIEDEEDKTNNGQQHQTLETNNSSIRQQQQQPQTQQRLVNLKTHNASLKVLESLITENAAKLEEYGMKYATSNQMCHFCFKELTSFARTTMECGKHHFHNHCAHVFLAGAVINQCLFCHPRQEPKQIYGGINGTSTNSDGSTNTSVIDAQMHTCPFDSGNDFLQSDKIASRSILFQTMNEYKTNYNLASVKAMLLADVERDKDILNDEGDRLSHSEIKSRQTKSLFGKVVDLVRDGMDMDINEKQSQYAKLVHFGDPYQLIKRHSSVSELRAFGVTPTSLYAFKIKISEFFRAGYTIEDIAFLGVTRDRMITLGFGFKVWQKYHQFISTDQLCQYYDFSALFVITVLCRGNLAFFTSIGLDYHELYRLRLSVDMLAQYSITWERFKEMKLTFEQWMSLGLRSKHLLSMGVSAVQILAEFPQTSHGVIWNSLLLKSTDDYTERLGKRIVN